ncbi:MAG: autotransporter-associated beta strand repeat-containing protein [Opitutaceae bacterium]|nr:autotransporter-associated beta strand repeat-containing protein [Opitutaceae bacterium]
MDTTPGNWADGAYAPPFDLDGDETTFSATELNRIIGIWQRVAEDFAIYDIDVTTEEPGIESLRKTSTSDAIYGIRVCIGGSSNDWYGGGAGGVAFVGSFDAGSDIPCWVFPKSLGNSEKNIAEATSHEVGHSLGLNHDGVEGGASYYGGQGNWAPIMGASYSKPISQWSKGEYANPNNAQDDLAVMLTQGAVYRTDDHGGTPASATVLSADSDVAIASGVIERTLDVDFFRLTAVGGPLNIQVAPAPRGGNLRLELKLFDAAGTQLQAATAADTTAGVQPVTLARTVTAGIYYLSVDGIGNGDPAVTGYSDYGSLGQYAVTAGGVVPGGFTWTVVSGGAHAWSTTGNWAAGIVPNAAGGTVRITNNIAGPQTIQLAAPTTLGSLGLGDADSSHAFTLAASPGASLVFDNSGLAASLAKSSGGDDVITAPVTLTDSLVLTQSASGTLAFSGGISGAGALTKAGAGTVVFASANTYTGVTILSDGLLRLDDPAGLPGGIDNVVGAGEGNLAFEGGVLGLASGDFTRQLGTGPGQLDWAVGTGGFAAFGANRQVRLNNGTNAVSWASALLGTGNRLLLSHPTATHTIEFRNGITFAGQKRTVQVEDGAAAIDAVLSGVLSGGTSSGLNKTGPGVLALTNANTYANITTVADGVLLLQNASALPGGNLELTGGGVLGLGAGDFTTRTIGTGLSQVQWLGSGGFSAFGADRAVKFGDSSINWTATNFIGAGRVLILGHDTADATLDWRQPISLNGSLRVVQVEDGSAAIDAKMSGVIAGGSSGTANTLSKTGAGTLAFTAQHIHWGDTLVNAGTLMIGDGGTTGGLSQNTSAIVVEAGAILAANRSDVLIQGTNPFKVAVTGDGGFTQLGAGETVFTLANAHLGPTSVLGGRLTLGAAGVLPDTSVVILGDATLGAGAFAETAGPLAVVGDATLDFSSGSALAFAPSAGSDWSGGLLDLTGGFVSGSSLRFGSDASGLTAGQLLRISINGRAAHLALNASGHLISGYEVWRAAQAPATGADPAADEDGDGVSNLLEFVLGGSAGSPDRGRLPRVSVSGGNLVFTFTRDQRSLGAVAALAVETSEDLVTWNAVVVPDQATTANPGVSVVKGVPAGFDTVTLSVPHPGPRLFARLRVTP